MVELKNFPKEYKEIELRPERKKILAYTENEVHIYNWSHGLPTKPNKRQTK